MTNKPRYKPEDAVIWTSDPSDSRKRGSYFNYMQNGAPTYNQPTISVGLDVANSKHTIEYAYRRANLRPEIGHFITVRIGKATEEVVVRGVGWECDVLYRDKEFRSYIRTDAVVDEVTIETRDGFRFNVKYD